VIYPWREDNNAGVRNCTDVGVRVPLTTTTCWVSLFAQPSLRGLDKDVLHESVARTNWDQGQLRLDDLLAIITAARPRLVGCDICGEVSLHHYQTRWKRFLSALDKQPAISPHDLAAWQQQQLEVNKAILRTSLADDPADCD